MVDHPQLAMQAARRMRRVKQKTRNSHVICHHLVEMLNNDGFDGFDGSDKDKKVGSDTVAAATLVAATLSDSLAAERDRQFVLAF